MIFNCVFLCLHGILVIRLVNYGSALTTESIVGGYPVKNGSITYQVSVQGKLHQSDSYRHICGAAIIKENMALSIAHCFITEANRMKEIQFFIFAGTINLYKPRFIIEVDSVYVPSDGGEVNANDIVVITLMKNLEMGIYPFLKKLALPNTREIISNNTIAMIAGYGYDWVATTYDEQANVEYRVGGGSYSVLKLGFVRILDYLMCQQRLPEMPYDLGKQICGTMLTTSSTSYWGVCTGDYGGALVVFDKVIGIAASNSADCNDTTYACVYTRVSSFVPFILAVAEQRPLNGTLIFRNLIFVS